MDARYGAKDNHIDKCQYLTKRTEHDKPKKIGIVRTNELGHSLTDHQHGTNESDMQSFPAYIMAGSEQPSLNVKTQGYPCTAPSQAKCPTNKGRENRINNHSKHSLANQEPLSVVQQVPDKYPILATDVVDRRHSALLDRNLQTLEKSQTATKHVRQRHSRIQHQIFYVDNVEDPGNAAQGRKRRVYRVKPSVPSQRFSQESLKSTASFVPIAPRPKDPVLPPEARGIAPKPPGHEVSILLSKHHNI